MQTVILGGARSGKSRLAERMASQAAQALNTSVSYIATAEVGDEEMRQRIEQHRLSRPEHWSTVEEPLYLAKALKREDETAGVILVDCLTLWLSNLLVKEDGALWQDQRQALLDTLAQLQADVIMVSNETGMGIVPMGELSRRFVDEAGWLHQALAQQCDNVILTVAGLPHVLKGKLSES